MIRLNRFIKFKRELAGDLVMPQTDTISLLVNGSENPN